MTTPLISVIIPVYNGDRYLSTALDSVFSQYYQPIEVIVVDDGSTDRTPEVVREYPGVRSIRQVNQGPGAARNAGIGLSHGEFVAFLDADDIWLPEKLSIQIGYLLEHPQVGFVSARMDIFMDHDFEWPAQLNREYFLQDPPVFSPSALLIRKVILNQVGMFDPQLGTAEDVDWFARAKFLKVSMTVIQDVLLHRRIHDGNISFNLAAIKEDMFTVLRRSVARNRELRKE